MCMTPNPCYRDGADCPQRRVGCREQCEAWQTWVAVHASETDCIRRQKEKDSMVKGFLMDVGKRKQALDNTRSSERSRRGIR